MNSNRVVHRYPVILSIILFVLTIFVVSLSASTVYAVDSVTAQPKGLTLSPLRNELSVAPGTSLDGTLKVTNSTDKPMIVDMSAEEFSVIDAQYDYAFTPDTNVTKWVTFNPSGINLKPGESIKITYTIGIPLSAEPGGLYISLFASTSVGALDGNENSQQRVGSLLYITITSDVLGAVTQAGHVLSLSSPWLVGGANTWSATLQNEGTTHYRSDYNVKVNNLFGGEVAASQGSALILPCTVRLISDNLPLPQWPGVYKIVYSIGLQNNPAVIETRYMLYLPQMALLGIIAVTAIIFVGISLKRLTKH